MQHITKLKPEEAAEIEKRAMDLLKKTSGKSPCLKAGDESE
jgi:hypothetical protein